VWRFGAARGHLNWVNRGRRAVAREEIRVVSQIFTGVKIAGLENSTPDIKKESPPAPMPATDLHSRFTHSCQCQGRKTGAIGSTRAKEVG